MADRSMGGEPAFPQMCADALDVGMVHAGMSLRDWFAGQALAGLLGAKGPNDTPYTWDTPELVASVVYALAEAMLAERAKAVSP